MIFNFPSVDIPKGISKEDWFNWKWQLRNNLSTKEDFKKYLNLSKEEEQGFEDTNFSIQSTPYYSQLASSSPTSAIRNIIIPQVQERDKGVQSMKDPLREEDHSPTDHIIHRYPDRVILLITDLCPIYCRYCTRKRFTAREKKIIKADQYQQALNYIKNNTGIREVILSGGDPLTLTDNLLEKVLQDIRLIKHIEIIRIGSRMPAVCPMRFSIDFVKMINKYQPVFLMSHFNHPEELTDESAVALNMLANNGIPVYNQMVLINGVNNHPAVVQALCRRLLFLRARPYYMFQCDPSLGTDHLRTSIENSKSIQKELWGSLSGLAIPKLAVDLPKGGGKVELVPDSLIHKEGNSHTFKGWDGMIQAYIDPHKSSIQSPPNIENYLIEWARITKQVYGKTKKIK